MSESRKTLWWVRSLADDVAYYRVDQKQGDGDRMEIAQIRVTPGQWEYQYTTAPLVDLATYTWRIVPVGTSGSDGTPRQIGPERVVRTPDAPDFAVAFDPATRRITFSEAT